MAVTGHKIYVKGNKAIIDQVVDGGQALQYEGNAKDCLCRKKYTDSTDFAFSGFENLASNVLFPFSDLYDENGDAWADQATFEDWADTNLGKYSAGGGGATLGIDDYRRAFTAEADQTEFTVSANTTIQDIFLGDSPPSLITVWSQLGNIVTISDAVEGNLYNFSGFTLSETPVEPSSIISDDSPNALTVGSDQKLYVSVVDTSGFVPYSGASSDLDLGTQKMISPATTTFDGLAVSLVFPGTTTSPVGGAIPSTSYLYYKSYTGSGGGSTTLPAVSGNSRKHITIVNKSLGNLTINTNAGANDLWTAGILSSSLILATTQSVRLLCDGVNWIVNP